MAITKKSLVGKSSSKKLTKKSTPKTNISSAKLATATAMQSARPTLN